MTRVFPSSASTSGLVCCTANQLRRCRPCRRNPPKASSRPSRQSSTYVRQGMACLLAAFKPTTGQRLIEVSARRTGAEYGRFLQDLATHYP